MSKFAESVKRVSDYLVETANRSSSESTRARLLEYGSELSEAYNHILVLEAQTSALPPDLGNIHDLPEELLAELSVAKTDELEDQIVTVINAYGGTATLDQILVGLFRKFKVIQKRRFIQNKLYRMDMVWSVPGRKGVYSTTEPARAETDAEIEAILGTGQTQEDEDNSEIPF